MIDHENHPTTSYWTAEEAHTVIAFLEVLRDQLWEIYGDTVETCFANQQQISVLEAQVEI